MTKEESKDITAKKHDMSVRSMNFSRYLMIRYFSAAYLFANLFWLIFSIYYHDFIAITFSGVLFVLVVIASIEQASKWNTKDTNLKYTKSYFITQLILNIVFAVTCYTQIGKMLFPFMTNNDIANIILTILIAGIAGALIILRRINNIEHGHDKYAKAIETFENNQQ